MGRPITKEANALRHRIETRITTPKFQELQQLLKGDPNLDMSSLIRHILENRSVKVFTQDQTLDNLMEELAALRMEIKAIGVNINQLTRYFNTYPEPRRKEFYAKTAFASYEAIQPRIEQLLTIVSKLAKKWLPESK